MTRLTNEQLAEFIQQGGADDLKPVLYDRIKHLMYKLMGQYYGKYTERFTACGVELADLRSECYPAFLKAVDGFKPAAKHKFTSYLDYHIKNAVHGILGIRNADKLNKKPLDNCTSLDKEIETTDGIIALANIIPDETAEQEFENALDSIQDEQTREVLSKALERLDKPLRDVIVLYYFEEMTLEAISNKESVSSERIRQRKAKAIRKLRYMPDVRMLREEQRIERHLHFRSWDNSTAYYKAQEEIAKILKRGDYLSYGKRQAIIYDCRTKQAIADKAEYQSLCLLEKILAEQECKRIL